MAGRKRYIAVGSKWVEVTDDYSPPSRDAGSRVVGDRHYDGLTATDGMPIDTRAKHRRYMKDNNLTTMDDFSQTWAKQAAQRAEFYQSAPDPQRKYDIARAMEQRKRR
jgi:hypothetical protein